MPLLAAGHKRTGACPTFDRPVLQRDGYLLRIPLVGGALAGAQAAAIAEIAGTLGSGTVELTNRGNLQVRGLRSEMIESALASLRSLRLGDRFAALVTISPFAGPAEHALRVDLVAALDALLADGPALSPKFVVHIDDVGGTTAGRRAEASLGLSAAGFCSLHIDRLGAIDCLPADAVARVVALADACRQVGEQARVAEAIEVHGVDPLGRLIGLGAVPAAEPLVGKADPPVGPFTSPDGRCFVLAGARFGRVDAEMLGRLGAVGLEALVTPWRSIAVAVPAGDPEAIRPVSEGLAGLGFLTDPHGAAAGIVSCIGAQGCWQTEVDTLAECERVVAERAWLPFVNRGTVHVSGCDKRCATRSTVALTRIGRADGAGFDTAVDA